MIRFSVQLKLVPTEKRDLPSLGTFIGEYSDHSAKSDPGQAVTAWNLWNEELVL